LLTSLDGRWAETNREQLQQHNSSLEFKLHRLRFIEYVERGACGQADAVQYAKNFAPFAAAHSKGLLYIITAGCRSSALFLTAWWYRGTLVGCVGLLR